MLIRAVVNWVQRCVVLDEQLGVTYGRDDGIAIEPVWDEDGFPSYHMFGGDDDVGTSSGIALVFFNATDRPLKVYPARLASAGKVAELIGGGPGTVSTVDAAQPTPYPPFVDFQSNEGFAHYFLIDQRARGRVHSLL